MGILSYFSEKAREYKEKQITELKPVVMCEGDYERVEYIQSSAAAGSFGTIITTTHRATIIHFADGGTYALMAIFQYPLQRVEKYKFARSRIAITFLV
jgi:hypothetical protein